MTALTTDIVTPDQERPTPQGADPSRRIDASRMKSPLAFAALAASALGAVSSGLPQTIAIVVRVGVGLVLLIPEVAARVEAPLSRLSPVERTGA